jgi:hypothetical protein
MSEKSPLDDFLENHEKYNANSTAQFIFNVVERNSYLIGKEIKVNISGFDPSKRIKNVLIWCAENPQTKEKLSKAVDIMVSGWERAKFMDLMDEAEEREKQNE